MGDRWFTLILMFKKNSLGAPSSLKKRAQLSLYSILSALQCPSKTPRATMRGPLIIGAMGHFLLRDVGGDGSIDCDGERALPDERR